MITLRFEDPRTRCSLCTCRVKEYRTSRKVVRSKALGTFLAREKINYCAKGHLPIYFPSEELASLVGKRCTYAFDVMVEVADQRFLKGRSCREIAEASPLGISERHARRLSHEALEVVERLHEASSEKLTAAMGRWVLQIDGTVDGEFEIIVAVRDALSGFLLYGERCHFERHEEIVEVLRVVQARYGTPCAAISDMRAGILSALGEVFPGVPRAICRYHFLRDEGKDLLEADHVSLGKLLAAHGVRAALKRALRALPEYQVDLLREVEHGYCRDPKALAEMKCRRGLERVLSVGESSGLGFPFTLRYLGFLEESLALLPLLVENHRVAQNEAIEEAVGVLQGLANDARLLEVRDRLKEVRGLFEALRGAMYPKAKGQSLSTEVSLTNGEAQRRCREVVEMLGKALRTLTPGHVGMVAKKIVSDYQKWEGHLFVAGLEGVVVPATNNGMERTFRRVRRNVRKRCGDAATGRQLTLHGERLLLYQNMANPAYVKAVFGEEAVAVVFGRERAKLPKVAVMGRKERERLLEKGQELLRRERIPTSPYEGDGPMGGSPEDQIPPAVVSPA